MRPLRIIFAGGGTGGHLYPALAIARKLEKAVSPRACDILFVGSKRGIEFRQRERLGYPLALISVRGFVRSFTLKNLLFPFALIGSLIKADSIIRSHQPDLVVGTGGYVSGPIVSRALAHKVTTVIQEQNASPGFTTRTVAAKADRVYVGFAEAREKLSAKARVVVTGNPIRDEIGVADRDEGYRAFELDSQKKTILVLGGSLGAHSINMAVLQSIKDLPADTQLLWQTGERDYAEMCSRVGAVTKNCRIIAFCDKIELAYAVADVAIARAGALTIAELLASKTPALLVPYPHAADDHQTKNACAVVALGAARMVADLELSNVSLIRIAIEMLAPTTSHTMKNAAQIWNQRTEPGGCARIVADICELLKSRGALA